MICNEKWDAAFVLFDASIKHNAISPEASKQFYCDAHRAGLHDHLSDRGVSFLNAAILGGDVVFAMDLMLIQRVDINAVGLNGVKPLFVSIESNQLFLMLFLIANQAEVFTPRVGWLGSQTRPSRVASALGHVEMESVLKEEEGYVSRTLSRNAGEALPEIKNNLSYLDRYGYELLVYAIRDGHVCLEAFLSHHGVGIDAVGRNGSTLIFDFLLRQELPVVRSLIHSGANVLRQTRDNDGRLVTPYELARSSHVQEGVVPLLLNTQRSQEKRQIATFLMSLGRLLRSHRVPFLPPEILRMIVNGFSLEIKDKYYKLIEGHPMVRIAQGPQGSRVLPRKHALSRGRSVLPDLIEWPRLPRVNQHGPHLLAQAVQTLDYNLVVYLVHSGVDIDAVCDEKDCDYFQSVRSLTPLMRSLSRPNELKMTKLLIGLGASLTKQAITNDGRHLTARQLMEGRMERSAPVDRVMVQPMVRLLRSEEEYRDRERIITFLMCMGRLVQSRMVSNLPPELLGIIIDACDVYLRNKIYVVPLPKNPRWTQPTASMRLFPPCRADRDDAQAARNKRSGSALVSGRGEKRFKAIGNQQPLVVDWPKPN